MSNRLEEENARLREEVRIYRVQLEQAHHSIEVLLKRVGEAERANLTIKEIIREEPGGDWVLLQIMRVDSTPDGKRVVVR